MKRGPLPNMSQPTVRILLVGQHTYQVSFKNVYGYLKTVLLDRCKKVGAQYLYYEKSYVISSEKLADLKKQFQDVLNMKTNDTKMKFKIEDFPMTNIKMILRLDKKAQGKEKSKNRIIFIDKSSLNRYFYLKKRIDDCYCDQKKNKDKKQKRITLIVTSDINKKFWLTHILQPKKAATSQQHSPITSPQFPQTIQLAYSQLSSKRLSGNYQSTRETLHQSSSESNKIYLITYDNLKFVQNSWILAEIQNVSMLIVDDSQFLVTSECELSTLENKKRNYEAFRLLVKNYPLDQEMILFFSKLPEPTDLYKILVLTKPKNFTGIKFSTTLNSSIFNESLFTPQEKSMYDEFSSWFRKRYKNENKCFKQIHYLLKNIVIKPLDEFVFKKIPDLIPALELDPKFEQNFKITLLESSSEIVEKFRVMDRKYKKSCPSINLKQILEDFHDNQKSSERKFQVTSKIDDHLLNKNCKNYFFEAKQLMVSSKFQMILKRLFFVINSQKERICIVLEDQKLQKRLKKYLKETQVEYVDYELPKANSKILNFQSGIELGQQKKGSYSQFDQNFSMKACILNIGRVYRQFCEIKKLNKNHIKRDHQRELEFNYNYSTFINIHEISVPVITTSQSIHFIDTFWNEFILEKQKLLNSVFNFQLSYIEETQKDGKISFEEVFKGTKIIQNYYLFDGSHEKMMLEKYLIRKQSIKPVKIEDHQMRQQTLDEFTTNILYEQAIRFSRCQRIEYLDIDDEFDKIEEQAKKSKYCNNINISNNDDPMQQRVFLPKFTKPDCKSFKEMLNEKLLQKNIDQILQEEEQFQQKEQHNNKIEINDIGEKKSPNDEQEQQIFCIEKVIADDDDVNKSQYPENKKVQQLQNIFPQQFLVQTIRLQPFQTTKNFSNIGTTTLQNNQPKDLFDQLLGPDYQFDCFNTSVLAKKSTQQQLQQVETQSQLEQDRDLIKPNSWNIKQQQQQQEPKDQLLLNFGYLAYYNHQQPITKKSERLLNHQKKQQQQSTHNINNDKDNSIEIISTFTHVKNRKNHSERLKNQLSNRINSIRPSQYLSQKIKPNQIQPLPFYQLPKQKRLSNKKLYEQAISKSKQLWQKKLRKQNQLLIIKTAQFQIDLKPKYRWKQTLTIEQKQQLKIKGINL